MVGVGAERESTDEHVVHKLKQLSAERGRFGLLNFMDCDKIPHAGSKKITRFLKFVYQIKCEILVLNFGYKTPIE